MAYGEHLYGTISFSSEKPVQEGPDFNIPDLMSYLPDYYLGVLEMEELQKSQAVECGQLIYAIEDSAAQLVVESATWGLWRFEKELGLSTDTSKSYASRREMIVAKRRGNGTTTPEMIRRTASAFSGGDVKVVEVPNEYSFEVHFVGTLGVPQNMAGLIQMIEEIKPAHLSYSFVYTYTWWESLKALKWNTAAIKTWNQLRTYR
ncbi:putative phage tail protein [Paenibacillus agri]|uniref:YmfQ family protein n=1 Tax=Paenibacillus agri TaxID=2744309 RepID=A0A850EIU4_9BACL|nr:putative phage tail protein [Paenibacillus agri]NUU61283.1 YmfQ family protein [Paenibacillus agri]